MAMPPQLANALANKGKKAAPKGKSSPALQAAAAQRVANFAEGLNPNPPGQLPGQGRFAPKKAKKGATK